MAAPVITNRISPEGIASALKLRDGYRTVVTFSLNPQIFLWEKAVTPSGMDNGDKVEQTTFWNNRQRTFTPRYLHEQTDLMMTVAYDPLVRDDIRLFIGIPQTITTTYNDGSKEAAFGWLNAFNPQEHTDGAQPEAQVQICFGALDQEWVETNPTLNTVAPT